MTQEEFSQLSNQEVWSIINDGGRFVVYTYAVSFFVVTFKQSSELYLLKKGEYAIKHGWQYMLASLVFGWWGIPWGPIYTIQSLYYGICGKDVTNDIYN